MKLYASIAVQVRGEEIMRTPRLRDKLKSAFGGRPDLRTGRLRASLEAAAIVDAVRDAMRRLDVTNAVALVIDNTVLFNDPQAKPDDLSDLLQAFDDNAVVFGEGFDELRLVVEHRETDLHLVAEVQARTEHAHDEAAVRVIVSGRIAALTPRPSEDAESYRKRAAPIAGDASALAMYNLQFDAFVARLRDALTAAMPASRVAIEVAESRIVRPGTEQPAPTSPRARDYDPYDAYYPNPLGMMANAIMWSALFSMAMPPHVTVVDGANHVEGYADDPSTLEPDAGSELDAGGEPDVWDSDFGGFE